MTLHVFIQYFQMVFETEKEWTIIIILYLSKFFIQVWGIGNGMFICILDKKHFKQS